MTAADLTEKLKELLMGCDCNNVKSSPLFTIVDNRLVLAAHVADLIVKQLAPEIEKMINQRKK
jgi:hypothetical protein